MDDFYFYERTYTTFLKYHYVNICKAQLETSGKYLWVYLIEYTGITLCTI